MSEQNDPINPSHYTSHPSSIECIEISKHLSGCLAQAFQYVWRCGQKDDPIQELKKAIWFIDAELTIDDCLILREHHIVDSLITRVSSYESTNKHIALARIALANAGYLNSQSRKRYLEDAKNHINVMIGEY